MRPSRGAPRWGPTLFVRDHASDTPPWDARSGPARSGAMAPVARGADLTTTLPSTTVLLERCEQFFWVVGLHSARRVEWPLLRRPRGPQRAARGGVSVTRPFVDTEGPRPGPHCWVVAGGVSVRCERGRASAERPLTRRAKQKPHAVKRKAANPPGKREAVTERVMNGWDVGPVRTPVTPSTRWGPGQESTARRLSPSRLGASRGRPRGACAAWPGPP